MSNYSGELLREEMKRLGWTQERLGKQVGIDKTSISKYINGHVAIPHDILARAAKAMNSIRLTLLANGTTTTPLLFDRVKLEFFVTVCKARQEHMEAVEACDRVLEFAHNISLLKNCSEEEKDAVNAMLDQNDDVNHVTDMVDVASHDIGADIEARNMRTLAKYRQKGYLSWENGREIRTKAGVR